MRFILIDRITLWEPGIRARAVKAVALSEDLFDDHFPRKPIFPGVLLIEGLAQLSGLLLEETVLRQSGRNVKALMSIVEKAKFRAPVRPGDRLEYESEIAALNDAGGRTIARASLDGAVAAECGLIFSFHEYQNPRLEARRAEVLALFLRDMETTGER